MNDLIEKAQLFYKLAVIGPAMDTIPNWQKYNEDKISYEKIVATLPGQSWRQAQETILDLNSQYRHYHFFNLDTLLHILADILIAHKPQVFRDILSELHYFKLMSDSKINDNFNRIVIHQYLSQYIDKLTLDDYLQLENTCNFDQADLRKAQAKIIKDIVDGAHSPDPEDIKQSIADMIRLMNEAYWLNAQFKERLAKHLGPGFYARVMSGGGAAKPLTTKEWQEKKSYTPHDIARMFAQQSQQSSGMGRGRFLSHVLNKADEKARQYLRSFLYSNGYKLFMLDEEMRPMDENYKRISWPQQIFPVLNWNELMKEDKEKWFNVFSEFQVVPTTSFV